MAQLKEGTTISGYLALHTGNAGNYNVGLPVGSSGDIQYNNSGSFGAFGSVNTYDIQFDKPLLLRSASFNEWTTEARILFDYADGYGSCPVYTVGGIKAGWKAFDNMNEYSSLLKSGSLTQNLTISGGDSRNIYLLLSSSIVPYTASLDLSVPNGQEGTIVVQQITGQEHLIVSSSIAPNKVIMGLYNRIHTGSAAYSTITYKRFNDVLILSYFPSGALYPYVAP